MIKPKECPQRGKAVKDESSQPPPPPSVLQRSLFSAVSFPKPLRACASLGASPRGSQWAPAGVRRGRGLQERSSSSPTRFSFPSLVYPAWVGFVLWRTPKWAALWSLSGNEAGGEGPWERKMGAVSDGPRQERGAKKFSHPESGSRKPVWPELLYPCTAAGVGRWSGKESWCCVPYNKWLFFFFPLGAGVAGGGKAVGVLCFHFCFLSHPASPNPQARRGKSQLGLLSRNAMWWGWGFLSNRTAASSALQPG